MKSFIYALLVLLLPLAAQAESNPITAEATSAAETIRAGEPFLLGVKLSMEPGWHTYGKDPGDAGLPTEVAWELPQGFRAGEVRWPATEIFDNGGFAGHGYSDEVVLYVEVTPPAAFDESHAFNPDGSLTFNGRASWLACADACVPGEQAVQIKLAVDRTAVAAAVADVTPVIKAVVQPEAPALDMGWALVAAFLGGLILNLMPCVLPVVSIKILGFVHLAQGNRRKVLLHALVYTLGILACFWALAGGLSLLRGMGEMVGWGFHLQSAGFVALLIGLLFVMSLSLFGVMEITLPFLPQLGGGGRPSTLAGSFSTGLLTTILATPCTGPFLGPVLGYAATLPMLGSLALFSSMGLGLASPYLLLSAFPAALKYVPKPGQWMVRFKQAMGFLMMASVLWLLWVFEALTDSDRLFMMLAGLLALAVAFWTQRLPRLLFLLVGIALMLGIGSSSQPAQHVQSFTPTKFTELRAAGKPVLIDFTAKWCATCQVNKLALHSETVSSAFANKGVTLLVADWTKKDPMITEWLARFGRNGVPLYLLYTEGSEPQILPQTLTPEIILSYLETNVR